MSKDTSTFSVSAAKALFEAAKKPEVRNAAIAAAKNPYVRQTAKNVAQDEKARGAVLNAVKDPSGGNKVSAAFAVADANRNNPPPPPAHRNGASSGGSATPGKLSGTHSAIRSQLENLHLGGSTSNTSAASSTSPSSYQSSSNNYNTSTSYSTSSYSTPAPPPPVPRHSKTTTPSYSTPAISTPHGIAKFDYTPTQADEMALRVGDTVLLSKKVDAEWFYGENQNSRTYGIVPSSYLDVKIPLKEAFHAPPPRPAAPSGLSTSGTHATAIYDYNSTEYGDLNFTAGAQILVTARVNEEWLEGECFGRSGIFPVQFVDCPNLYQVPMKQQPAPSFSQPLHINSAPKQNVTVSYDYDSGVATDLRLFVGDVITVLDDVDSQWLFAECRGQQGMVPKNFLGPPYGSPKKSPSMGIAAIASAFSPKKAVATGDYHSEDPKHLYVTRGDHLLIVEDVDDYYYKGKLEAFKTLPAGILPKNIVKLET